MIYAPVVIPTLCRYEHFRECIESLQRNSWAKYTEIYIGLDYPTKDSHWMGYNKIKNLIENGVNGFSEVYIFIRDKNMGASKNIDSLLEEVRKKHDRYILSEDDNIFSTCFLEYMDKMIEVSKSDDSIFAVCGYSYPMNWYNPSEINVIRLQSFFSAWGYGTLFSKYDMFWKIYTKKYLYSSVCDNKKMEEMKKNSPKNFVDYMNIVWFRQVRAYDVNINSYLLLENKFCLLPGVSLVRNCGWDGSGINCSEANYDYSSQKILDNLEYPFGREIQDAHNIRHYNKNEKMINEFYKPGLLKIIKANLKLFLMKNRLDNCYFAFKRKFLKIGKSDR